MDYEEYTSQQYMTVFWKFNRKNNNYLDTIYVNHINEINCIDINDLENIDKYAEYLKIITDYETFISKINGLRECLNKLFENSTIKKIESYEIDFNSKINNIYIELCKKTEIKLPNENFIKFMYKNTPEGRVIQQNNTAIKLLNDIKNAEDFIIKIKSKIRTNLTTPKVLDIDTNNENYDTDDNESENKSTCSLSD